MKKTISITDVKRPIELPLENYEDLRDVVDHWCDGGDVEIKTRISPEAWGLLLKDKTPRFNPDCSYRIKKRDPQKGEVWITDKGEPQIKLYKSERNEHDWALLNGSVAWHNRGTINCMTYAAPSVEAYIARKLIDSTNGMHDCSTISVFNRVSKAARLDEE